MLRGWIPLLNAIVWDYQFPVRARFSIIWYQKISVWRMFLNSYSCSVESKRKGSSRINFRCRCILLLFLALWRMNTRSRVIQALDRNKSTFSHQYETRQDTCVMHLVVYVSALRITMRLSMLTKRSLYATLQRQQPTQPDKSTARSPPDISRQPVHGILISEGEVRS